MTAANEKTNANNADRERISPLFRAARQNCSVGIMTRPGKLNLITDVAGLKVGQAEDFEVRTGVTVLLAEEACTAAVDVRGGAPGTRETEALDPVSIGGVADAIALSGGSVYGLDAASGVMAWLGARGRGLRLMQGAPPAPIVPAAIIFDL